MLACPVLHLHKTLEQRRAGLGRSPRTILDERRRIQSTDVVLPTEDGRELRLRCVVRPDAAQATLLDRLGLDEVALRHRRLDDGTAGRAPSS